MPGEAQAAVQGTDDHAHPNPPSSENNPSGESSSTAATGSTTGSKSGPELSDAMKDIAALALVYTAQIQDLSDNACNSSYLHVRSHNTICDIHGTLGETLNHLQQDSEDNEQAINCLKTLQTSLVAWLDKWEMDFKELHRQYRRTLPYRQPSTLTNPHGTTFAPRAYREVFQAVEEDDRPELERIGLMYYDGQPDIRTSPSRIPWAMYGRTLNDNSNGPGMAGHSTTTSTHPFHSF
ncbi:MAG: hypothetical protein OHK93_001259 [Ramalina farinacea]|uniref:Uncharacterized protein n=1 Tax=Ramalina farinacea TaxID=258253 RepID=A0AA43QP67_9LECA|nr:hypothetical protein [Ramalina farinacea]